LNTPVMTLGERWLDHYLAGITWIQSLMGRAEARTEPRSDPTPVGLVRVLQALAGGRLRTTDEFPLGKSSQPTLVSTPPPLLPEADYLLIGLNAQTARSRFASLSTGGVVFEDPLWALLVAHAISRHDRSPVAVPKARSSEDLWERVFLVARAIEECRYQPEDFFGPIEGWLPPSNMPKFELLTVGSDQIAALRARGIQALKISRPPKLFELYQPPLSTRGLGQGGSYWGDVPVSSGETGTESGPSVSRSRTT
jgi:hypothetical protein